MAVVSWTDIDGAVVGTSYASINATQAVTVSGSSLTYTPPAVQVKHNFGMTSTQRYKLMSYLYQGSTYMGSLDTKTSSYVSNNTYVSVAWNNTVTINTSTLFKASNKTSRTVSLLLRPYGLEIYDKQDYMYSYAASNKLLTTVAVTLDVPPTATVSAVSFDTPYVYAGLTTASVTVSSAAAYYGGDVTDVTLTIGNQSDSISGNGTLSILLDSGGTFTPTVTVTDSRGQTKSYQLDPITVQTYVPPSVSFDADRTNSSGQPDDEGTYGLITATLTFADVVATAIAPSVVLTDENGTQTTPTVTWYTDDTLTTTVTWSSLSSGDVVYGIFSGLNTQYSYQVSVRPRDSEGTGDAIVQTISSAFYTVDFLAGGHGIAFGQPASQTGFFCNMDASFVDANDVMRALFDFIHPVGSYYETSDTSFDPNVTWGGTWSLEAAGQVHVSAGTGYTVAGALTNTSDGGETKHTLNTSEIPSHQHTIGGNNQYFWTTPQGGTAPSRHTVSSGSGAANMLRAPDAITRYTVTDTVGGGGAHNNMQPYIIVNRWHRTA